MSETPRANDISAIVAQVEKAFSGILGVEATRKNAQDVAKAASQDVSSHRVGALLALSDLAETNSWSPVEIEGAVTRALDKRNDKVQSLVTFGAEIKKACNPAVRKSTRAIFKLATDCFEAEKDAKGATPCRKAFQRAYFMAMRLIGEALKGRTILDAADAVAFARENDPALDAAKIAKRLNAIRTMLGEMHDDFPHDGLQACVDYLGTIDADELTRARNDALSDDDDASPEEIGEPEQEDAPVHDPLDAALNGLVAA